MSLAIDDCYEVWDTGVISVPYNFRAEDLRPRLLGLLADSSHQDGPSHDDSACDDPDLRSTVTADSSHSAMACNSVQLDQPQRDDSSASMRDRASQPHTNTEAFSRETWGYQGAALRPQQAESAPSSLHVSFEPNWPSGVSGGLCACSALPVQPTSLQSFDRQRQHYVGPSLQLFDRRAWYGLHQPRHFRSAWFCPQRRVTFRLQASAAAFVRCAGTMSSLRLS